MENLEKYLQEQGIWYHANAAIKPYLTMGIGGSVRMVTVIDREPHLKAVLLRLQRAGLRFVLLGGGSNVIFPDDFLPLVVIINRTADIARADGHTLKVNSGVFIKDLMEWNIQHNAGGMEFLAGIPGTVGGAAAVNAGAFGQSISSFLEKAEIITHRGEIKTVNNDYFRFTYRDSAFKYGDEIILNVFLNYTPTDSAAIKEKVAEKLNYRKGNHPDSFQRSAGCFFKNPILGDKKSSAGKLIEQLGFKGAVYNGLHVSDSHANFIVNRGKATFEDIIELEGQIIAKAFKERGIKLQREVIYISPDGTKY